jgi:hypothetical protein
MHRTRIALCIAVTACSTPQRVVSDSGRPDSGTPEYDPNPCAHLLGGPPGVHLPASDLGRAFSLIRHFSTQVDTAPADAELSRALNGSAAIDDPVVAQLAALAPDVCQAPAQTLSLGTATVTMRGTVAVVVPGSGAVPAIPSTAKAVAIDVRGLPATEEARAAFIATLQQVSSLHGGLPDGVERICNGLPDEVYTVFFGTPITQYVCQPHRDVGAAVDGQGPAVPLAVLTAAKLTPVGAFAALALKATARAFMIGENVSAPVAESTWVGVGGSGLAVRTRVLEVGDTPVDDVVAADLRTSDPLAALDTFDFSTAPGAMTGIAGRTRIEVGRRPTTVEPPTTGADGRAAVIGAYAAARAFYPYFDVVGDIIDARLDECLGMLASDAGADRGQVRLAIKRFAEALHDGHVTFSDSKAPRSTVYPPLTLMASGTDVMVAQSAQPDVQPGDVLLDVGGAPTAELLSRYEAISSGSPQATLQRAFTLMLPASVTAATVRGVDGGTRSVMLTPTSTHLTTLGMFDRVTGPLADLGASDVEYVNLDTDGPHPIDDNVVAHVASELAGKRGVVLDLRGYPNRSSWKVLAYLAPPTSFGPRMSELNVTATSSSFRLSAPQLLSLWAPGPQVFTGPVVLLVGPQTQSQAEHFTFFFTSLRRGKVIGSKTAGADGTITGVQLAGGYGLTFTGMRVDFPDGEVFHAHGITPDIEVYQTADDLRARRDTVLLRALQEIP